MYFVNGRKNMFNFIKEMENSKGNREIWVQSLGWEDALEKGKANYSSVLAWRIPWTEETGLQSMGSQRVSVTRTHTHTYHQ